jgi:RimJ/RimL family protein N-acetyltransferase
MTAEFEFPRLFETSRLALRIYGKIDAPALLMLIDENRDQLRRNFAPLARAVRQPMDALEYIDECSRKWADRREFVYGIWHTPSNELVGQLKVKNVVWDVPAAELSYFIGASSQRRGFAAEAIATVARAAIDQLSFKRICLRVIASNLASLKLAEKLGFKREGVHRNEFRCGLDQLHDVVHYSLTGDDLLPGEGSS